ncbi:MAPEG family protein [Polymorphobacter fuscus]|uniref:MAPEG family protein n=1 Tax=Sandarakinorhabdus fusca TaxID=1439888 RepID=A0A7C9LFK4_9SPHN|nr:MAPEG family protein [Polymorphobacter fuscus]KAB7647507.1 MAPEG family protein [Polymorphobacter fuscus]MQT16767.1 MAPEG family protein [Polymorphobacter fuscus]NJC09245.1 putative membrane protein YecN with MAPEG domain [Polymorphobacter fuscus]
MASFPLTTLTILVALLILFGFSIVAGRARMTYNVPAPQAGGHPEFDKRNRVHLNTMEQIVLFLPAIALAAPVLGDAITAMVGLVWCIGRLLYARSYYVDPAKRSLGFALTMLPTLVLIGVAAWGALRSL